MDNISNKERLENLSEEIKKERKTIVCFHRVALKMTVEAMESKGWKKVGHIYSTPHDYRQKMEREKDE